MTKPASISSIAVRIVNNNNNNNNNNENNNKTKLDIHVRKS